MLLKKTNWFLFNSNFLFFLEKVQMVVLSSRKHRINTTRFRCCFFLTKKRRTNTEVESNKRNRDCFNNELIKMWIYLKEKAYFDVSKNEKPLKSSNLCK